MAKPKKPFFDVSVKYTNLKGDDYQSADWRVVGRAFQEPDGKIIVMMGGMPFPGWDGTMVLFPYKGDQEK